jgi:(p)ppGpp synthase/HD superfamily hydrolase
MSVVDDAERLARTAHAEQRRKGASGAPYFTHLESVARRLREGGHDDDLTVAAAYLHDLLEDQPSYAPQLRRDFPSELVATIEIVSEPKLDGAGKKLPKPVRVAAYMKQLATDGPNAARARAVSCADKIDNLHSLMDSELAGEPMLNTLTTRPGQHAEHAAALRPLYASAVSPSLLASFDAALARLADYLVRWLPGHAVAIAAEAHTGQFDRAGAPYILHPLRLMMRATTREEQMVAVLHDVVEDTPWTLTELADEGFPRPVLDALDCLTRRETESYEQFIDRVAPNKLAARVKLLDLEDNLNPLRLPSLNQEDLARFEKYHRAREKILKAIS